MISNSQFLIDEFPVYHPKTLAYRDFWINQEYRKIIEGTWVSGKWMPPTLYFYGNYATIELVKDGSKSRTYDRPMVRDLEWNLFLLWAEARGFSGFELDTEYTCNRLSANPDISDEYLRSHDPHIFKPDGTRKTYIWARDYLRKIHPKNLGSPRYMNEAKNLMMLGPRTFGKEIHNSSRTHMFKGGTKQIKDVVVGDIVIGRDGLPTTVTGVYPQGIKELYEFTLADGRTVIPGLDHQWTVHKGGRDKLHTLTTRDIINDPKFKVKHKRSGYTYKYQIPEIEPVQYEEKDLPIHPYILGALLGDGNTCNGTIRIATDDLPILDKIMSLLPDNFYSKRDYSCNYYTISYRSNEQIKKGVKMGAGTKNPLLQEIKILGQDVTSYNKFIPDIYKYGSIEQRLELIRGLMDTDGSIATKTGAMEFAVVNERLARDLASVLRSLGARCKVTEDKSRMNKVQIMPQGTEYTASKSTWRVHIRTNLEIFSLPRKLKLQRKRTRSNKVSIIDWKKVESAEATCITVDNDEHLFLVEDYIPTHNSYSAGGGIVAHEFTVDGRTKFDLTEKSTTNIIVGAGDAKYSSDLLQKTKLTLDRLPGEVTINGIKYPSPFSKITSGSLHPGKEYVHKYKKKVGTNWETVGTLSKIKNRTFKDNPYAAQGNRCGVMVFEEIGMFGNMMDSYNACVDVMQDGHYKFGSALFIGTGGAMESGGTLDAYKMFYSPRKFNLLEFEDIWEHSQTPIAYFVPSYMGLHQYKDSEGNTLIEAAKAKDDEERNKLMDGKSSKALDSYIAYHPRVPSEVFLTTKGAFFPVAELQNRLRILRSSNETQIVSKKVELFFDPKAKYGVNYQIDIDNKLRPLDEFPTDQKVREGCVVIYEMPQVDEDGDIPKDLYIIGHDPYSSDNPEGNSLASIYVIKTKAHPFKYGHDEIVAQYVGRPHLGRKIVNEILLKLSMFYGNAKIYFENATGNTKEYFEKHKKLSLLCKQPRTVLNKKASFETNPTPIYGYPMSNRQIKLEGIQYLRDWLIEERGTDIEGNKIRNLDLIADQALIQELIQFNLDGNFDRCLSKGTLLTTDKGYTPIEDIQVGDKVLTHNNRFKPVTKKTYSLESKMSEIKFVGSQVPLVCTQDHPIYTTFEDKRSGNKHWKFKENPSFKEAKDLIPYRDFVFIPKYKSSYKLTSEEEYLIGWYIGDGNIKNNSIRITLSKKEKAIAYKLAHIINKLSLKHDTPHHNTKKTTTIKDKGNYFIITKTSKYVTDICKKYGGTANNKKYLLNSIESAVGILEAEGHYKIKNRTCLEVGMKDEHIILNLRQVLINNGIWCTYRITNKGLHHLSIPSKYAKRLAKYSHLYPEYSKQKHYRNVAIETDQGFYTPVKHVKNYIKPQIVYNCEVEEDHSYVSNLITTHNCMGFMGCVIGLEETFNQYENQFTKKKEIVDLSFLNNNKSIFANVTKHKKLSTPTTTLFKEIS